LDSGALRPKQLAAYVGAASRHCLASQGFSGGGLYL
jgi:hypothetical protein